MATNETRVRRLRPADARRAQELLSKVEAESQPDQPQSPLWAERGFDRSLMSFNFLSSDSFWFLAAELGGELVGYATAARIPKASGLLGTLYVDELYVLRTHRRCGIGAALVSEVHRIAKELGYWRVRLIADRRATGLRRFYEPLGFRDDNDGFFQREVRDNAVFSRRHTSPPHNSCS